MLVLGIETSCDETAIAIVEDGRKVIANQVLTQIFKHQAWGGVIPEVASRLHLEYINDLLLEALKEAKLSMNDIDVIAVTSGPGLTGSLMVGASVAKVCSWVHNKPLLAVNHLYGHVCANFIDTDLEPPFICMLASGGHTQVIEMSSYTEMRILGETVDDAAGEAFDKVARLMGLPYPGGPELDRLAQQADYSKISEYRFPVSRVPGLDFSFSGIKTAVLRLKEKLGEETWQDDKTQIARAFQETIAKTFLLRIEQAIERTGIKRVVLAGGVSANSAVRKAFKEKFIAPEYELVIPSLKYCTDNAAMIASAGYFQAQVSNLAVKDYQFEVYSRV